MLDLHRETILYSSHNNHMSWSDEKMGLQITETEGSSGDCGVLERRCVPQPKGSKQLWQVVCHIGCELSAAEFHNFLFLKRR
jgi:hypothetical protein